MSKFSSLHDALKHFEENNGGGRNSFFVLKDDKDTAVVRFLHEGEDDLDWYIVHRVEIEDKPRYVQCTEQSDCPLCKSGNKPQLKLFLQLVDKRDGQIKTWERGQKFIPKILSTINRYGNLCSRPYEIERLGKKGDTKTDYQLYPLDQDNKTLDELPQRQKLLGENGFILQKSYSDMEKIAQGTYKYENVEPEPRQRTERSGSDIF